MTKQNYKIGLNELTNKIIFNKKNFGKSKKKKHFH